jgi:hypothetical protein
MKINNKLSGKAYQEETQDRMAWPLYRVLGDQVRSKNCISEPGLQDPYRDMFLKHPVTLTDKMNYG